MKYDYLTFCWAVYLLDWVLWLFLPCAVYTYLKYRKDKYMDTVTIILACGWLVVTVFGLMLGRDHY